MDLDRAKEVVSEGLEGIEPCIVGIARDMNFKIRKNANKPCPVMNPDGGQRNHKGMPIAWYIERAEEELNEFREAASQNDDIECLLELADVANFIAFAYAEIAVNDADAKLILGRDQSIGIHPDVELYARRVAEWFGDDFDGFKANGEIWYDAYVECKLNHFSTAFESECIDLAKDSLLIAGCYLALAHSEVQDRLVQKQTDKVN